MQVQMQSLPAPQEVALETTGARLLRLLPMWTPPSLELHTRGCLESFPAAGSFPVSRLFPSSGQSIEASASASVFPMNTQG